MSGTSLQIFIDPPLYVVRPASGMTTRLPHSRQPSRRLSSVQSVCLFTTTIIATMQSEVKQC